MSARVYRRVSLAERFWAKVEKTHGCWLWVAALHGPSGYGVIAAGPKGAAPLRAHRVSWELHFGRIPDDLCVLHRCDVNYAPGDQTYRRCVRPNHLFLGTRPENQADMKSKGRAATGQRNGSRIHPERMARGEQWAAVNHPARGSAHNGAKLSEMDVRAIRAAYQSGSKQAWLASQYGVSRSNVGLIVTRRGWTHID
jgi:hypothetical protein